MSTDHQSAESLPGSLRDRMQSALTDATGWFAAALSGERAARDGDEAVAVDGLPTDPGDDRAAGPSEPPGDLHGEIVTPEERILGILTDNGGSVRQGEVVSAVEWSESTVSRKLSKLEAAGTVTRYQIGREKLVFLPGQEPESLGSPWREVGDASGLA